jgi:hypothetical protein
LALLHEDAGLAEGPIWSESMNSGPYSGGSYSVNSTPFGLNRYRVLSTSHLPLTFFTDLRDTIEVILRMLTEDDFRMYGWLTNFPGNDQFFFTEDTVWGALHANGQFHTHPSHSPVFHGHVSVRGINPRPGPANNAKFLGGYTTGVRDVPIPDHFDELIAAANSGGFAHNGNAWVYLNGSSIDIYFDEPTIVDEILPSPDATLSMTDAGFNGTIYIDGNVYVKGTLEGQLSIGAGNTAYIDGNIKYSTDPPYITHDIGIVEGIMRQEHEGLGTDLFGLVSANDIIVNHSITNNLTNLELHGIFFAMGKFNVTNLPNYGTIDTWGSMIQGDGRATFRLPSGAGYRQRYRLDTRLEDGTMRPPAFPGFYVPMGFEIVNWYESIQLPKF